METSQFSRALLSIRVLGLVRLQKTVAFPFYNIMIFFVRKKTACFMRKGLTKKFFLCLLLLLQALAADLWSGPSTTSMTVTSSNQDNSRTMLKTDVSGVGSTEDWKESNQAGKCVGFRTHNNGGALTAGAYVFQWTTAKTARTWVTSFTQDTAAGSKIFYRYIQTTSGGPWIAACTTACVPGSTDVSAADGTAQTIFGIKYEHLVDRATAADNTSAIGICDIKIFTYKDIVLAGDAVISLSGRQTCALCATNLSKINSGWHLMWYTSSTVTDTTNYPNSAPSCIQTSSSSGSFGMLVVEIGLVKACKSDWDVYNTCVTNACAAYNVCEAATPGACVPATCTIPTTAEWLCDGQDYNIKEVALTSTEKDDGDADLQVTIYQRVYSSAFYSANTSLRGTLNSNSPLTGYNDARFTGSALAAEMLKDDARNPDDYFDNISIEVNARGDAHRDFECTKGECSSWNPQILTISSKCSGGGDCGKDGFIQICGISIMAEPESPATSGTCTINCSTTRVTGQSPETWDSNSSTSPLIVEVGSTGSIGVEQFALTDGSGCVQYASAVCLFASYAKTNLWLNCRAPCLNCGTNCNTGGSCGSTLINEMTDTNLPYSFSDITSGSNTCGVTATSSHLLNLAPDNVSQSKLWYCVVQSKGLLAGTTTKATTAEYVWIGISACNQCSFSSVITTQTPPAVSLVGGGIYVLNAAKTTVASMASNFTDTYSRDYWFDSSTCTRCYPENKLLCRKQGTTDAYADPFTTVELSTTTPVTVAITATSIAWYGLWDCVIRASFVQTSGTFKDTAPFTITIQDCSYSDAACSLGNQVIPFPTTSNSTLTPGVPYTNLASWAQPTDSYRTACVAAGYTGNCNLGTYSNQCSECELLACPQYDTWKSNPSGYNKNSICPDCFSAMSLPDSTYFTMTDYPVSIDISGTFQDRYSCYKCPKTTTTTPYSTIATTWDSGASLWKLTSEPLNITTGDATGYHQCSTVYTYPNGTTQTSSSGSSGSIGLMVDACRVCNETIPVAPSAALWSAKTDYTVYDSSITSSEQFWHDHIDDGTFWKDPAACTNCYDQFDYTLNCRVWTAGGTNAWSTTHPWITGSYSSSGDGGYTAVIETSNVADVGLYECQLTARNPNNGRSATGPAVQIEIKQPCPTNPWDALCDFTTYTATVDPPDDVIAKPTANPPTNMGNTTFAEFEDTFSNACPAGQKCYQSLAFSLECCLYAFTSPYACGAYSAAAFNYEIVNTTSVAKSYDLSVQPQAASYNGTYSCKVKGVNGASTVYSTPFTVLIDACVCTYAQPIACDDALPDFNIPSSGLNAIPIGDTGGFIDFPAFTTNVTQYCKKVGDVSCDTFTYALKCRAVNSTESGSYTTAPWTGTISTNADGTKRLTVKSTNINHKGNWRCKVVATHTVSSYSAETPTKLFSYTICENAAQSCKYNTFTQKGTTSSDWGGYPPLTYHIFTDGVVNGTVFRNDLWLDNIQIQCGSALCGPVSFDLIHATAGPASGGLNWALYANPLVFPKTITTNSTFTEITSTTTDNAKVGSFPVTIRAVVAGTWTGATPISMIWNSNFVVNIEDPCNPTKCEWTSLVAPASDGTKPGDITCYLDNVKQQQTFDPWTNYMDNLCSTTDCGTPTYKLIFAVNTNEVSATDFDTGITILNQWCQTQDLSLVGDHDVRVQAYLNSQVAVYKYGQEFTVTIEACDVKSCAATTLIALNAAEGDVQPGNLVTNFGVGGIPVKTSFTYFRDTVTELCPSDPYLCGEPDYQVVCNNATAPGGKYPPRWTAAIGESTTAGTFEIIASSLDATDNGSYVCYVNATLPISSTKTLTALSGPINVSINYCVPLPCNTTEIKRYDTLTVPGKFDANDMTVYNNGTVSDSTFSAYYDVVTTRCGAGCCPIKYKLIYNDTSTVAAGVDTEIPVTYDITCVSGVCTISASTAVDDETYLGEYSNTRIQAYFDPITCPAQANIPKEESQSFEFLVSYPDPCDPLRCDFLQILSPDPLFGDVIPQNYVIDVHNTPNQTTFTEFKDSVSEACTGTVGSLLSGGVYTPILFGENVCGQFIYKVMLFSDRTKGPTNIFGAENWKLTKSGKTYSLQAQTVDRNLVGDWLFLVEASYNRGTVAAPKWVTLESVPFNITVFDVCKVPDCTTAIFKPGYGLSLMSYVELTPDKTPQMGQELPWVNQIDEECDSVRTDLPQPICPTPPLKLVNCLDQSPLPFPTTVDYYASGNIRITMATDNQALGGQTFQACIKGVHTEDGKTISEALGSPFTIAILRSENTPPTFDSFPADQKWDFGQAKVFSLDVLVNDNSAIQSLAVTEGYPSWIKVSISGNTASISATATVDIAPGDYEITFTALDDEGLSVTKTVKFTVRAPPAAAIMEQIIAAVWVPPEIVEVEEEPYEFEVWIESISMVGLMTIEYSKPVIPVMNLTAITREDFKVSLFMYSEEPDQTKEFDFNLTYFAPQTILVPMKFIRPLEISQGWKKDQACVWMKREFFMVPDRLGLWKTWKDPSDAAKNKTNGTEDNSGTEDITGVDKPTDVKLRELEERNAKQPWSRSRSLAAKEKINYEDTTIYYKMCHDIPLQVADEQTLKALESSADTTATLMKVMLYLPFVIQFFLSAAMSHVWNLLNTMQILNTFALYKVNTPANVKTLQLAFQSMCNLDIIDKEAIYAAIFGGGANATNSTSLSGGNGTNISTASNNTNTTLGNLTLDKAENFANKSLTDNSISNNTLGSNSNNTMGSNSNNTLGSNSTLEIGASNVTNTSAAAADDGISESFKDYGMGSTKTLQVALQLIVGCVLIVVLIKCILLFEKHLLHKTPKWFQSGFKSIKGKIMYNSILRASIESYMVTTLGCFLALKTNVNFRDSESIINSLTTFALLPYIVGFPIFVRWFLLRNKFLLADPMFKSGYNALYLNVDYFKPAALLFQPILLGRRGVFAFNAVFCGTSAIIQLAISLYCQQFLCQFHVIVKPMVDTKNNFIQIFNEWCILMCAIINFAFTDWVPDPEDRYVAGGLYCNVIYAIVIVNGFMIFSVIVNNLRSKWKSFDDKWKFNKRRQAYLEHNKKIDLLGAHLGKEKRRNPFKYRDPLAPPSDSEELPEHDPQDLPAIPRTVNQQRKDRKEIFNELMNKLKSEQAEADTMKLDNVFATNEAKLLQEKQFGPPLQEWEDAVWDDLFVDPSGNVIRQKNPAVPLDEQLDFEVMSSPSVRDRRELQKNTDWPLSARAHEEKKAEKERNKNRDKKKDKFDDAGSNQWDWDIEKEGSKISDWNAVPLDFKNDDVNLDDSSLDNEVPFQAALTKKISKHVGKVNAPKQRDDWNFELSIGHNTERAKSDKWESNSDSASDSPSSSSSSSQSNSRSSSSGSSPNSSSSSPSSSSSGDSERDSSSSESDGERLNFYANKASIVSEMPGPAFELGHHEFDPTKIGAAAKISSDYVKGGTNKDKYAKFDL